MCAGRAACWDAGALGTPLAKAPTPASGASGIVAGAEDDDNESYARTTPSLQAETKTCPRDASARMVDAGAPGADALTLLLAATLPSWPGVPTPAPSPCSATPADDGGRPGPLDPLVSALATMTCVHM